MSKEASLDKCKTANITILPKGPYEVCGTVPIRQEKMTVGEHGGSAEREK
ncbi:MAG: hypothetical protein LBO09_06170 [Candidatus Peribacteria bacterium]|nr:hypothetical protein [Candidatus Peribacteria bacterium]